MPDPMNKQHDDTETDRDLRRYYQRIVDQAVPARFKALFDRLREDEKELEHEG